MKHNLINLKVPGLLFLLLLGQPLLSPGQIITTIAGTGQAGYNGDEGSAKAMQLNTPFINVDKAGNVYIGDRKNNRVRRVDAGSQKMTTIAGNGILASTGDGGPAVQASMDPACVALDPDGHLYISDYKYNRIRKVDRSTGIISTIAGTGALGSTGDGGPAVAARIYPVSGMAFDRGGNLYFSEADGHKVRRIDKNTGIITTVAGYIAFGSFSGDGGPATAAGLNKPAALVFDSKNNMYLCDGVNRRIRKVDAQTGMISTYAGTGGSSWTGDGSRADVTSLAQPYGLAIDPGDNVYISLGALTNRVIKVDALTRTVTTVACRNGYSGYNGDNGPALNAECNNPYTLSMDAKDNLYIGDLDNHAVRKIFFQTDCAIIANGKIRSTAGYSFCNTGNTTLSLEGLVATTALKYEWQSSADSINWNFETDAATVPVGLNTTTHYRCILSCASGGPKDTTPVTTVFVGYPVDTVQNLSLCRNEFPLVWNGIVVPDAGNAVAHFATTGSMGCDSLISLNLQVTDIDSVTQQLTLCRSQLPAAWQGIYIPEDAVSDTAYDYYVFNRSPDCDSIVTLNLTINECPGTALLIPGKKAQNFHFYPNPNKGAFTIEWLTDSPEVRLRVMDITGRIVLKQTLQPRKGDQQQIRMPSVASGNYILNINDVSVPFVIQNSAGE